MDTTVDLDSSTRHLELVTIRDIWRDRLNALCGSVSTDFHDGDFFGKIESRAVGRIELRSFHHNAALVSRSRAQMAVAPSPFHTVLLCQISGCSRIEQAAERAVLQPGDLAFVDMQAPFSYQFEGAAASMGVYVPDIALSMRGPKARIPMARAFSGRVGLGAVVSRTIESVFLEADLLNSHTAASASEALAGLLAGLLTQGRETCELHRGDALHYRLCKYIEDHLTDCDLSPASIASAHGVSVRHVHRTFARSGTSVSDLIRDQRLSRCRDALTDSRWRHCSILQLAYHWGFSDSARFSRLFKAAYGLCPRDYRQSARCA